ncbi:Shedu immune nuclease family protein [Micromonospora chalcea]
MLSRGRTKLRPEQFTMGWLDAQPQAPREEDANRRARHDEADASIRKIAGVFVALGQAGELGLVEQVLRDERRIGYTERMSYAEIAAGAALVAGYPGVRLLTEIAADQSYKSWAKYAVRALWLAASGEAIPGDGYTRSLLGKSFPIADGARREAKIALDELINASKENRSLFSRVMTLASEEASANHVVGGVNDFSHYVMRVFAAGSISVPPSLLDDFEALVAQDLGESSYQEFLKHHPTVLDPLAAEVVPKHQFGDDYVPDFVIRRHDFRYLVVEIEKPKDRIFNKKDDFTGEFSHALGQVLDFQGWVAERGEYARSKLPSIENPRGLLVIGRRSALTEKQEKKLRRWCVNSSLIDVVTFDDLVISGRQLFRSLHGLLHENGGRGN